GPYRRADHSEFQFRARRDRHARDRRAEAARAPAHLVVHRRATRADRERTFEDCRRGLQMKPMNRIAQAREGWTRLLRVAALAAAASALAACGRNEAPPQPPPPEVAVQTVQKGSVPLDLTYTARTVGSREVDVRARVAGIL